MQVVETGYPLEETTQVLEDSPSCDVFPVTLTKS